VLVSRGLLLKVEHYSTSCHRFDPGLLNLRLRKTIFDDACGAKFLLNYFD
jgi:hypothetical protein